MQHRWARGFPTHPGLVWDNREGWTFHPTRKNIALGEKRSFFLIHLCGQLFSTPPQVIALSIITSECVDGGILQLQKGIKRTAAAGRRVGVHGQGRGAKFGGWWRRGGGRCCKRAYSHCNICPLRGGGGF